MSENIHATGIVLDGSGVLLRGPSGAGKSLLALSLIDRWEGRGLSANLVADDRLDVAATGGVVMMRTPPRIAGLAELRGRGIVRRPHVAEARVDLVVDLVETLERMVEEVDLRTDFLGVALPRCPVPRAGAIELGHQILLVSEALRGLAGAGSAARQKTT
ncbi:MAG TPA: serine/threonine protein kinase [Devosia sp.]|nr:serine/threonine protein kinase [Devosia sp.]